ncbi:unnamed protein product [Parnassius apollo]|uniref:(apollo) hypothetical protein n=1 Tax=Parnassius apollo TaxID=110799 RepID=A0A8S3WVG1_PARAO|nr:unnamed protein product [Parnassius apollo]
MKKGSGIINKVIDNLPFELHLPGYQFCGPKTELQKRLLKADRGINKLDEACMLHDIGYTNKHSGARQKADLELLKMAKRRLKSEDARKGEKIASWIVKNAMKAKIRAGGGIKAFKKGIKIQSQLKKLKSKDSHSAIKYAYAAAKKIFSNKN